MDDVSGSAGTGWNRYYVHSSALLQRDLSVFEDASLTGDPVFSVAGENRTAEILDSHGSVVMRAARKGLTANKIEYTHADGTPAANLKINSVLSAKYMEVALAGGGAWTVVKDAHVKHAYAVLDGDVAVVTMDLTSLVVKRDYPVDIAEGVDLPLALGVVWALNFAHLQKSGAMGAAAAG